MGIVAGIVLNSRVCAAIEGWQEAYPTYFPHNAMEKSSFQCNGGDVPDVVTVLADAAIGGEVAKAGDIKNRHARPMLLVTISRADLGLARNVGTEVGKDKKRILLI